MARSNNSKTSGSQANPIITNYINLNVTQQNQIITFLNSL